MSQQSVSKWLLASLLSRQSEKLPHTARHNEELARVHVHTAAIGIRAANAQTAAQHEEHLILALMRVPRELALDTRYFYKLIVDLTHHSRRPQLRESLTREFE